MQFVPCVQTDKEFYTKLAEGHDVSVRSSKDSKTEETRGRGVFADRDFKEGEIVFAEEPLVSIADSSHEVDLRFFHPFMHGNS
jgi:hypothetical protein